MGIKEQNQMRARKMVLDHLEKRGGEATVYALATELGWPWQRVAKVLQVLTAHHAVATTEELHKDYAYRVRRVVKYRRDRGLVADPPAWLGLVPQPVLGGRLVTFR